MNAALKRIYGWAQRGVKAEDSRRGSTFHRTNIAVAQTHEKNGFQKIAALCYQGTMNAALFEDWFENNLLKSAAEGCTIIMDNTSFHRKKELEVICKKNKAGILFLPPYSPDLNPIEKSWANMKRALADTTPLHTLLETAIYKYWC